MKIRTSNRCRRLLRKQASASCYLCRATEHLLVHHLNWEHSDDTPSNLVIVCQRCHTELHKAGYLTAQEMDSIRAKIELERTGGSVGGTPALAVKQVCGEASQLHFKGWGR